MIVDLTPTEEQQIIADSIAEVLARALPVERMREARAHGGAAERGVWNELVDVGLFRFGLPDVAGGIGYGVPEETLAARAYGRHCLSPSVLATMLGAHIAHAAESPDLRDALMNGSSRAAFAISLDATEVQLIDAAECDWLLLPGDPARLLPRHALTDIRAALSLDDSLSLERARLTGDGVLKANISTRLSLLLAAYLVGNARATLDMAVSYAGVREQFGQPIGAFQAIKHSCADMAVRAAAAEAQTFRTAIEASAAQESAVDVVSARWLARDAAVTNAKANIQVHGGMGFTAECDAHLFLKRALVISAIGSDSRSERRALLAH